MTDTAIFSMPPEYDFGYDFDYASWDQNTELLLTNVPWNSDYRDIVVQDSKDALDTWLEAQQNVRLSNTSTQKFNEGIVKIDLPVNEAMKYNYLRARNGTNPVSTVQRDYYYFITGVRYGAPNTTYLSIQVDAISTFLREVQFGTCYVERGHIGIANQNQFQDYGRSYLTVPESTDIGGEYRNIHVEWEEIMGKGTAGVPTYDVLVCSTIDLVNSGGTVSAPIMKSAQGSEFEGIPSGADFYLFKNPQDLFNYFIDNHDKPWLTQGIVSITLIPNMSRYHPGYDYGADLDASPLSNIFKAGIGGTLAEPKPHVNGMLTDWRDAEFIAGASGVLGPYRNLKKFLTAPYLMLELTSFTSSPLAIKPESWQDPDATIVEYAALLPPSQRIALMPHRYNYSGWAEGGFGGTHADTYDVGEFMDFATWIDDFPQVPAVNNSTAAFLASNKNGLAFSFQNASWNQQRALASAGAAYDVQNAQIQNTARQSAIANTQGTDTANTYAQAQVVNSIVGAAGSIPDLAGGIGGAAMKMGGARAAAGKGFMGPGAAVSAGRAMDATAQNAGGIAGAATGMVQAGISANASMQAAAIASGARGQSAVSDIQTAGSVRDTNNAFATMAAKGDYHNEVAGIQAKIQDAAMLQPSVSGQFAGSSFNLINGFFGYSLRWKFINDNAVKRIGNYWLRYGYAINQYIDMPASLHCMQKFTYWKLTETYISRAPFPEGFKQIIRGVFEKGVTVWRNPDDIGNTNFFDNEPLEGIYY